VRRWAPAGCALKLTNPAGDGSDVAVPDPTPNALAKGRIGGRKRRLDDASADRVKHRVVRSGDSASMRGVWRPARSDLGRCKPVRCIEQLVRFDWISRHATLGTEGLHQLGLALRHQAQTDRRQI